MDWSLASLQAAQNAGISQPSVFQALIGEESRFNPNALSSTGAVGLGQILPSTASSPGYGVESFDAYDPESNLQGSANYFAALLHKYNGSYKAAATAYNVGPGAYDSGVTTNGYTTGFNSLLDQADQNKIQDASDDSAVGNWIGQSLGNMFAGIGGGPANSYVGGLLGSAASKYIGQSGIVTSVEQLGLRAAIFIIGIVMFIVAIVYMFGETDTGKTIEKVAAKVAVAA